MTTQPKFIFPLFAAVLLSACAYNQKPVVDIEGVNQEQYQQDFTYCQGYAEQVSKGEAARVAAINTAVPTAIMGAIAGGIGNGVQGALGGAVAGGTMGAGVGAFGGATSTTETQALVLRQCLKQKGYKVYDLS
ncbi:glycine zipper family protein [Photobacterium damselae subsp. damselae]|uniref:glycine zipper family protein n=1 Tax=Photobacterium damselae TaxID=38293 RepID=UPI001F360B50|nr:glycine zipper family protein [Photobacterium damselae]UKA07968.1 glycine zipper family protein [Photobacterium damselae subsp. damselae]UKA23698.1 glycine zipper family protein [Photobacterium damselae subsp. damselae]